MGEIIGSEVGKSLSPGFGSIRAFRPRRRKPPFWLLPLFGLAAVASVVVFFAER